VAPAASVSFLLKAQVPGGAAPGTYEVQGRVYSADSAPEESSVLSGRVVFEVAAPPAPAKRRIPWWIVAVAVALVVITVVVVTLVVTLGGGAEQARPQPSASGPMPVPDLAQLNEAQAVFALKQAGLVAGPIRHRFDAAHAESVLEQSVKPDTVVAKGTAVGLVIAVRLSAPVAKTAANAPIKFLEGKVEWDQPEAYVTRWIVSISVNTCLSGNANAVGCGYGPMIIARADAKSYMPPLRLSTGFAAGGNTVIVLTSNIQWSVSAVDDFGTVGPGSAPLAAQMVP
jgi:hypothetical protein